LIEGLALVETALAPPDDATSVAVESQAKLALLKPSTLRKRVGSSHDVT
jgi:hypothetical protein